jgi:septum formation protein
MSVISPRLVLASLSPRRRELLAQLGLRPEILELDIEETPGPGESAESYVVRVAAEKSAHGQSLLGEVPAILAADTEVVLDGEILGKPRDTRHGREMLARLAGRRHEVLTAVSLRQGGRHWQALNRNEVRFRPMDPLEIAVYVATGEPADKAGAYAIQGLGALFVEHLAGSFSGVMGLPLFEVAQLLKNVGIDVLSPPSE